MDNKIVIDGNLFCCLSQEQQEEIKTGIAVVYAVILMKHENYEYREKNL